jgi:hypothetical protein
MPDPPQDYHICPCCGTEFGSDDSDCTYDQLRDGWIRAGAPWFFRSPPLGWSPQAQLLRPFFEVSTLVATQNAMTAGAGANDLGQFGSESVLNSVIAGIASQQSVGELLGEL